MKILIPVIVGSLIGYLTNWLAIKMLFKPHYEKKIFGMTLPFTPGLIPKERKNIAKNIGNTVGVHLLSTDTIMESILNSENEKKIKIGISKKIEDLKEEEITIDDYIELKLGEKYKLTNSKISNNLSFYIVEFIRNDKFKKTLNLLIDENLDKWDFSYLYEDIEVKIKSFVNKIVSSDFIEDELEDLFINLLNKSSNSTNTIENILPIEVFDLIDNYLDEHQEEIGDSIRTILKDKEVNAKIKDTISNIIFDRSNKLLMAFISPDLISQKVFESIEKYIEKKETNEDIIDIIKFLIQKLKSSNLSSLANPLRDIIDGVSLQAILNNIVNNIFNDEKIDSLIEELLKLLKENETKNKRIIKNLVCNKIEEAISSQYIEIKITQILDNAINNFGRKTIGDIFNKVNDDTFSNIYNILKIIFHEFIKMELPKIIDMFNISKIVEDKMNSFEIDYTEKLILDIARRELNQITRLGALLGGILGLLSPLLQYIY